jgi:hypothetical protein
MKRETKGPDPYSLSDNGFNSRFEINYGGGGFKPETRTVKLAHPLIKISRGPNPSLERLVIKEVDIFKEKTSTLRIKVGEVYRTYRLFKGYIPIKCIDINVIEVIGKEGEIEYEIYNDEFLRRILKIKRKKKEYKDIEEEIICRIQKYKMY